MFYCPVRVRYAEVDSQRHVYFGHYLSYFDVALIQYLKNIDYAYQTMVAAGVDMFHTVAKCECKGRARFDDLLHVYARIGQIGNTSFTFEFTVRKQPVDEMIATGQIVAVAVDAETEQPVRVPDGLRQAVDRYEAASTEGPVSVDRAGA